MRLNHCAGSIRSFLAARLSPALGRGHDRRAVNDAQSLTGCFATHAWAPTQPRRHTAWAGVNRASEAGFEPAWQLARRLQARADPITHSAALAPLDRHRQMHSLRCTAWPPHSRSLEKHNAIFTRSSRHNQSPYGDFVLACPRQFRGCCRGLNRQASTRRIVNRLLQCPTHHTLPLRFYGPLGVYTTCGRTTTPVIVAGASFGPSVAACT